ncbi:MAG: hypothetical protein H7839_01820 [Magnetococcus sp. YQC-5]
MITKKPEGKYRFPSGFLLVWLSSLLSLWACAILGLSPTEQALSLAKTHNLQTIRLQSNEFLLTGFFRHEAPNHHLLVVYIEGDGLAWINRETLSPDPTPRDPVALRLMIQDPTPNALYLGRPCQYVGGQDKGCNPVYWSTHRYAKEVVASMSHAIDTIKQQFQARHVGLIGYSGGGVIAALLVASRSDVSWWITVAANLDLAAWTAHHQVTPMPASQNPVDFVARMQTVPQTHFIGGQDRQVPESVIRSFLHHFPASSPVTVRVVPDFSHGCCWVEQWPNLLAGLQGLK